jgi:hypothetical protein
MALGFLIRSSRSRLKRGSESLRKADNLGGKYLKKGQRGKGEKEENCVGSGQF